MTTEGSYHPEVRVLRIKQVQDRLGLGRSTIYDRLNPNSPRFDSSFPKPFRLGGTSVGWLEADVVEWIQRKVLNVKGK
ncbi:helix-turn-helix transcriptional regulator [Pseudomonas paraeruginosa]|uniref:helix-turn-helix transcriptional regulator n=1 Tax=Pseudomonas aeruginosa group TaxID=136841 RepID=UPI0006B260AD|nr:AlpA family transcriptional regulator [Pseudomonas aeruginosa]